MACTMRLRGEDLEWREADGEILVLDRRAGRYFAVTGSGVVLWIELARGTGSPSLARRLEERYGMAPGQARQDVDDFLGWLRERELLVD